LSALAVTPEQCGIWSCPKAEATEEEVIFNMVNCMLGRIHQSGSVQDLSEAHCRHIKKGISCYKSIRKIIPISLPFWPRGLPSSGDSWLAMGLSTDVLGYLAVWRLDADNNSVSIPLNSLPGKPNNVRCIYPMPENCSYLFDKSKSILNVTFPAKYCARLFEVQIR
jgi:alpha-galactosidase